jgi:hypothetical protein
MIVFAAEPNWVWNSTRLDRPVTESKRQPTNNITTRKINIDIFLTMRVIIFFAFFIHKRH